MISWADSEYRGKKQRPGNDVPSERLHPRRVKLRPKTTSAVRMQLVDEKKQGNHEELPPTIYAALVDSLFQNFTATLAGTLTSTIIAVMTALKTGNHMVWPCA